MAPTTDIDLLLIGKTGVGKSALGNSILKRERFKSTDSMDSVTTEVQFEYSEYKGKIIKVVDTPGVGDTRFDKPGSLKHVFEQMGKAMVMNPQGYHAILLVVKYGGRFTEEDKETIEILKKTFGPEFVSKHCILAMTHGDDFQRKTGTTHGETFSKWCTNQTRVFQDLLKECNNRIMLFDNNTEDEEKRDAQLNQLLKISSQLPTEGQRYTDENFKKAAALRKRALIDSKKPVIQEETMQEISLILQKLKDEKNDESKTQLQELSGRCDKLVDNLKEQDKQTGSFQDLIEQVQNVKQSIDNTILTHSAVSEAKEKIEEKEKQMKAEMDNEMQRKTQQIEDKMREMESQHNQQCEHIKQQGKMDREQMEREFARKKQDIEEEGKRKLDREIREFKDKHNKDLETMKSELLKKEETAASAKTDMTVKVQNLQAKYDDTSNIILGVVTGINVSLLIATAICTGHLYVLCGAKAAAAVALKRM